MLCHFSNRTIILASNDETVKMFVQFDICIFHTGLHGNMRVHRDKHEQTQ